MALEWNNSLSTGVPWQDSQHRELFKRINKLLDAMDVGLGKDELVRLFDFLDEYAVIHFHAEEEAMDRTGYQGMIEHLREHTEFIDDMARLRTEFAAEPSITLLMHVKRRLVDWLLNHIGSTDKRFGEFMHKSESERKGRL